MAEAYPIHYREALTTIGRIALNALYPKEFEHYFFALELVDADGKTVEYFAFPILPDQLNVNVAQLTSISKSLRGVISVRTDTFVPVDIDLSGTFGKSFKILLGRGQVQVFGIGIGAGVLNGAEDVMGGVKAIGNAFISGVKDKASQFNSFAKTGYGCVKILERLADRSVSLDAKGRPYTLYCYNPITGNNYIVEVLHFRHAQDKSSFNMLPSYSLKMKGVADLDVIKSGDSLWSSVKNIGKAVLQNKANAVFNNVKAKVKISW